MNIMWIAADMSKQFDIMEEYFKVPEDKKADWVKEQANLGRVVILGHTNKTAPELATELIKKGIKAKSFIKGKTNEPNGRP